MSSRFDPIANYESTRAAVGWVERRDATPETYRALGFKCGLEIHQQLKTDQKLFCRCPAAKYHDGVSHEAELVRHMRPTLSELGEYDGTALMEFKTRKTIIYRIRYESACTYDVDDTPPFHINPEAIDIAIEIALLLKMNLVGEFHITRKQYLDGSIPTGFQRTGIIGIEGGFMSATKPIRMIQMSIEEDSCREVSDFGHLRVYTTDRLGMPLIEMVTYPDMLTPDEAAEAGQRLRFLTRSTGKVRTGIGAARQDVNVSVTGGTRVEIKGVPRIRLIPALTHTEAFRQYALLLTMQELKRRVPDPTKWQLRTQEIAVSHIKSWHPWLQNLNGTTDRAMLVALPQFAGLLSHFTQPGKTFATELSDRLKVIACLERPNLIHTEMLDFSLGAAHLHEMRTRLKAEDTDAVTLVWGPAADMTTAIEVLDERCRWAFRGVPNETRRPRPDGRTEFERVLPGPDRMYPDTDSAPIPIQQERIDGIAAGLPVAMDKRYEQLQSWQIPIDAWQYLLSKNLIGEIERCAQETKAPHRIIALTMAHTLKGLNGRVSRANRFSPSRVVALFRFLASRKLSWDLVKPMLKELHQHPSMAFDSVLLAIGHEQRPTQEILAQVPALRAQFARISRSHSDGAGHRWAMRQLRRWALGNIPLAELSRHVEQEFRRG